MSGIRAPYIRVLGVQVETSGSGRTDQIHFTPEEEREFRYDHMIFMDVQRMRTCF